MYSILELQKKGVTILNSIFTHEQLLHLIPTTEKCFINLEKIIQEKGIENVKNYLPSSYNFRENVTSLNICALNDYSPFIIQDILTLVENRLIQKILTVIMGEKVNLNFQECWLRKQYAPSNYHKLHHPHTWHQDGSLGLNFPFNYQKKYLSKPLNKLITLWLPLTPCGINSPSLQFITQNLKKPLHFNYLKEEILKEIFNQKDFYAPTLKVGDAVIFLNGTLHKTYVTSTMTKDRISIELRFFVE